ncbi:MAG: uncharacterized membrane protein YheB (UPF0754 family) [Ulvibacter sp.]|jgi:uncharacterized membrane protein YheB (UPF0754 family)
MLNKPLITNIVAIILIIIGYFVPAYNNIIVTIGVFSLSGALTNWIAVHMLFEKVPLLYGSGVIINRFEDFKVAIKNLIIDEFFNKKYIKKFFSENRVISAESINKKIDFDRVFDNLTETIMKSQFGSMLSMFGGKEALDPLKEPIIKKLQEIIIDFSQNSALDKDFSDDVILKIEKIIDSRLQQLTPKMVKNIISNMIKKHLGWLVVWGGLFGGLIGAVFAIILIEGAAL